MGTKKNPQLTIPSELYQELQALADEIGVSSPAQIISLYHRTYKADLRQRLAPNYSPAVVATTKAQPSYSEPVADTPKASPVVAETKIEKPPLAAFAEMTFD